jgi:acetyl-CoA carboxylase carboxyl transferase subunit beta
VKATADTGATSCGACQASLTAREFERALFVCPRCGHHARLSADRRLAQLVDGDSFRELDAAVRARTGLEFPDTPPYAERLRDAAAATGHADAVVSGVATIEGRALAIGVFDFAFMGGSMGAAVGERLTRLIDRARRRRLPLVIVSASGGARMQEGMTSLMQMAKLTGALGRLRAAGVPYVSVLTDPTTGGVAASVALLGDVNLAEPGALIGFAGPRVIERTPSERMPEHFQRAEFQLAHGLIDRVVERRELRPTLARLVAMLVACPTVARPSRVRRGPRASARR